ncbi:uncharacterized protein RHO17_005337 [Thomomys bottae]
MCFCFTYILLTFSCSTPSKRGSSSISSECDSHIFPQLIVHPIILQTPCFVLLKKGAAQSSEAADLATRSPVKAQVLAGHDSQSIAAEEQESCEGREHKQPLTTDQINGTGGTNVFSKSSESVPEESALPHYEHFSMQSKQHRMEGEGQLFQTQDAIHSCKISSQLKKDSVKYI